MIDWPYVGWSALWILGLSIELAVLSIVYYLSGEHHQNFGQILAGRRYQLTLDLGMVLFCLGLAALAVVAWQRLAWGLLCAGFTVYLFLLLLKKEKNEGHRR
jgi:hypothetical protein